jgi:multidrug efflux pump subunit AcrA (membrane-fusion protein)
MKVLVTVEVGDERGILSIPKTALFFKGSDVFVRLKKRAHWVEQPIKIGRRSTERIEVLDGLSVGDKIANPYSSE